jgi:hypothetical protein
MTDGNLLTDWREKLVAHLKTSFPDVDVESGERDGTSRNKDLICVFWPGLAAAGNVNFAQPRMTIRFWRKRPKTALKDVPHDDGPLEQAAWDLALALQPVLTTLDQRLYFEVQTILPVRDEYAIEAQLLAWTANPATLQAV